MGCRLAALFDAIGAKFTIFRKMEDNNDYNEIENDDCVIFFIYFFRKYIDTEDN